MAPLIPASLAWGALLLARTGPQSRAAEPRRIRIGEGVVGSLSAADPSLPGRGPARWYAFTSESGGPVTASLDSRDFDAYLRVDLEGGGPVAENDDGWLFTNARVVFEAAASTPYRIAAAGARAGACGEFELRLVEGEPAPPSGDAFLEAAIAFQSSAAERALARGDRGKGGWHRLLEGSRRMERQEIPESRLALGAALDLAREVRDPELEERALLAFGRLHSLLANYPAAIESLEQQIRLAREIGQSADEGAGHVALGGVRARMGAYAAAIDAYERALALYRTIPPLSAQRSLPIHRRNDPRWAQMGAHASLGDLHFSLRDHGRALEHGRESLRFAREIPSREGEARALVAIGEAQFALGDFAAARGDLKSALRLARDLALPVREVQALGRLGEVLLSLGEYPEAKACFQKRLAVSRELGDPSGEGAALSDLGSLLSALGDHAGARASHEQALRLARDRAERPALARALGNLGRVSLLLGEPSKAARHFEEESRLAAALPDDSRRAEAALGLGLVHFRRREFERAGERFEEAALLARRIGERPREAEALAN
ncbi:MAG: tetratricopeptide repeat protein, partial [Planctomycetes bacterium]|nr:tetratricopeptide repeat protein [Planctomycetota bacterium]